MDPKIRGLEPGGPPSTSMVNLILRFRLSDAADATPMMAIGHWILARVPCVGELVIVRSINLKVQIDSVWWDSDGRVAVNLREVKLEGHEIETLETDGWSVAPMNDEPPPGWFQ